MAERDRFSDEEWTALTTAPGAALTAVVAADHAGLIAMFKEARAFARAAKHGRKESEWPPVVAEMIAVVNDQAPAPSGEAEAEDYADIYARSMEALSAAGVIARKLTSNELDAYVRWVVGLGTTAAEAVKEKGEATPVSAAEREALDEMERRLRSG